MSSRSVIIAACLSMSAAEVIGERPVAVCTTLSSAGSARMSKGESILAALRWK